MLEYNENASKWSYVVTPNYVKNIRYIMSLSSWTCNYNVSMSQWRYANIFSIKHPNHIPTIHWRLFLPYNHGRFVNVMSPMKTHNPRDILWSNGSCTQFFIIKFGHHISMNASEIVSNHDFLNTIISCLHFLYATYKFFLHMGLCCLKNLFQKQVRPQKIWFSLFLWLL